MNNLINDELVKYYDKNLTNEILDGLNCKNKVTLRVNTLKSNREEIEQVFTENNIIFSNVSWYKDTFIIENCLEDKIYNLDIFKDGKIYMQSLSSMIPPLVLNPKEGENILDMAAAPGGKTTQLATLSNNQAWITACEKNKIRGEKLKYNLNKQGATKVNVMFQDSRELDEFFSFDKILLDAPCSGSGTENVFKDNFTLELINKSVKTQEVLLNKAVKILKKGGTLVYSTCSILPIENDEIVKKILRKYSNLKIEPITGFEDIPKLNSSLDGTLCIKPSENFEGFYVAKIYKN